MDMIMIEGTQRGGWTLDLRIGSGYRQTSYVRTPAEMEAAVVAMVRLVHSNEADDVRAPYPHPYVPGDDWLCIGCGGLATDARHPERERSSGS